MISDHVKLTQKYVSPRCFVSRFSEGLITFQNLLNRSTVPSSQTSQVACEPASKPYVVLWQRGGKRKESLHVSGILFYIEKVDAKWWLAEMTLVMTSLPLARVFRALFHFVLIGGNLTAQSKGSHRELEAEFKFQRRSCKLSFLFPPSR